MTRVELCVRRITGVLFIVAKRHYSAIYIFEGL